MSNKRLLVILALLLVAALAQHRQLQRTNEHTKPKKGMRALRFAIFASMGHMAKRPNLTRADLQRSLSVFSQRFPELGLNDWTPFPIDKNTIGFRNDKIKEITVCFRALDPKNPDDAAQRAAYHAGNPPPRAKEAIVHVKNLMSANPDYKMTITGYSLGGAVAETVAMEMIDSVEGYSFSAGTSPKRPSRPTANIRSFYIEGDTVSENGSENRVLFKVEEGVHVHSMDNYFLKYKKGALPDRL